jgi:ABC-2 type transport system ATP-binding protein
VDEGRTVFISSHILGEVQKMADDVAIIQKGKMIAFGSVDELVSGGSQKIYVRTTDVDAAAKLLHAAPFVKEIGTDEFEGLTLTVEKADDATLTQTGKAIFDAGIGIVSLYPMQESLEQRFLEITGGEGDL